MSKWGVLRQVLGILVMLPVVAVVALVLRLDPNDYKAQIVRAVQDATGRTLAFDGKLRLSRSLWPTLEVSNVSLSNLPGGTRPDIARAERIEGQISLVALLGRRVEITNLTLIGPNILFEEVDGRPNWLFATPAAVPAVVPAVVPAALPGPEPTGMPQAALAGGFKLRVRSVHIRNGMVTWRFPARTKVVGIRSLDLQHPADAGPLDLRSTLVYADNHPFALDATAQPTGGLLAPWTTRLQFAAFDTAASATGTMDASGHYDLQVEARAGALEKLNALLPEMALPPVRQATLSSHVGNGRRPGDLPVLGNTRLQFAHADLRHRYPGLTLDAIDASLAAPGDQAVVSGAGVYGGAPFSLKGAFGVPIRLDGPVSLPVELKVEATSKLARGSLALKGKLALETLRFAGLDTAATLTTPALSGLRPLFGRELPALTDIRFDGRVRVPAGNGPVRLEEATLLTRQGDLHGSGTVAFDQAVKLVGAWHSDHLDLDALLEAFGIAVAVPPAPRPVARPSAGPMISAAPVPWAELTGPTLDLAATADTLKFQNQTWHDVRLSLTLKGGRLKIDKLAVALPTGTVELTMSADASTPAVPFGVSLHAPAVPLAMAARYAGLSGPATGTVRMDAELHGSGRTVRELAASLDGPFSVAAVNGQFSNAALIEVASAALDALGIAVPPTGQTRLACLGIAGAFAKGVGTFRTIAMETTYLSLGGVGQVDLGRETVAFQLSPLARVAGAPVAVPVVVEGPFRAVKGRLEATGLDKLGLLFDGLFGGDTSDACAKAGLR